MPKRPFFALLIGGIALVLVLSFKTPEATTHPPGGQQVVGSPSPGSTTSGTFTGNRVRTPYGPVQVQVTLENGRITAVQAVQLPFAEPRSQELNDYAVPKLIEAVLQAQSARVDTISGATSTSEAFIESLQSALDQANG